MIRDLQENPIYSITGIAEYQLLMNSASIAVGVGARVPLEDNIWYDKGRSRLASNTDLIRSINVLAEANG